MLDQLACSVIKLLNRAANVRIHDVPIRGVDRGIVLGDPPGFISVGETDQQFGTLSGGQAGDL
jgi:hypothetical protein